MMLCLITRLLLPVLAQGEGTVQPPAACEAGTDAETHLARGRELRQQTRDLEALEEFRCARLLAATPRALAQIALAEQALGRWADAEAHLAEALRATGDAWIATWHKHLDDSLAEVRRHLGRLQILGDPPGAEVRVDDT